MILYRETNTLDEILRQVISKCHSHYQLSKQANVAESVISRFVSRQQGISLATANKLAAVLGLTLKPIVR